MEEFKIGDRVIWWDPGDEEGDWPGVVVGEVHDLYGGPFVTVKLDGGEEMDVAVQWLKREE